MIRDYVTRFGGKMFDPQIAKLCGVSLGRIAHMRRRLGIPGYKGRRTVPHEYRKKGYNTLCWTFNKATKANECVWVKTLKTFPKGAVLRADKNEVLECPLYVRG